MAKEYENQQLRQYTNRRKRYKRNRNIVISVLLLVVAVVGICYVTYLFNKTYQDYKIINSTDIAEGSAVGYLSYGSSVVKYGKDGVQAYDRSGKQSFNASYNMADPITDMNGEYIAIADRGGKQVYIYKSKGQVGTYTTPYNITKIEIADQGVAAVLMEEEMKNHIKLYDLKGEELAEVNNTVNNAGYPMDFTLSEDGRKLVVAYLSVAEGSLVSKIQCLNFDDVGDNHTNQMVGADIYKGIVVPKVEFLNNDTFCVYLDNGIKIYSMREIPELIQDISLEGKIKSIFYNSSYTGVVLESEDGSSETLKLYDLKGKQVLDKSLDFRYTKIFMTEKEIIMHNDLRSMILKLNGKVKYDDTFDSNIDAFFPIDNLDHYYLINKTKLNEIQLLD